MQNLKVYTFAMFEGPTKISRLPRHILLLKHMALVEIGIYASCVSRMYLNTNICVILD